MNQFLSLLFGLLAFTLTGCAPIMSALPAINTAITDTALVLQGIDTTVNAFETIHPLPPADLAEYQRLLGVCYQSLTTAERTVADLKQVNQGQYDQAFADFEGAFKALTAYLKQKGITPASSAGALAPRTASAPVDFPTPRVIGLRVE